jgi:hypothetical protein
MDLNTVVEIERVDTLLPVAEPSDLTLSLTILPRPRRHVEDKAVRRSARTSRDITRLRQIHLLLCRHYAQTSELMPQCQLEEVEVMTSRLIPRHGERRGITGQ